MSTKRPTATSTASDRRQASTPPPSDFTALVQQRPALLAWYDRHARPLPWRNIHDPYASWVSELMCQQTRVDTVIPYFERWMARFPTPAALAATPIDDVLLYWQGLGYYRRARNLHAGAQQIVEEHGGVFPATFDAIRALPGVGPYTAGAIASIAFGLEVPAVDGNVLRVLSRCTHDDGDIQKPATVRRITEAAQALAYGERPGDVNQALMEIGATTCQPTRADCLLCPLQPGCQAAAHGDALDFPVKAPKVPPRIEHATALLVEHPSDQSIIVAQRREDVLLGGLWEIPLFDTFEENGADDAPIIGDVRHLFSHIDLRVTVRLRVQNNFTTPLHPRYAAWRWADAQTLKSLPQSTLMRKLLRTVPR